MKLDKNKISENLKNILDFNITVLNEASSTNTTVKELAKLGAKEGTVVIADYQNEGRGRYNRRFYSPPSCGIYMSILLKPTFPAKESVLITAAAAVAVNNAILNVCGKETQIKWVNDIFLNDKKICGILTEGSINVETGGFDWAVLGLGVNVYEPENGFDCEIKNIAGSITNKKEENLRNRLCAEIINCFFECYSKFEQRDFLEDYRDKSNVIGKNIIVIKNGNKFLGKAIGIDNECRLLVEFENGEREFLSSGEISLKIDL